MDIVERLAQQAAETINGGEFYDGKWYTEGQRQAWRKAMTPAAAEIERLRGALQQYCDGYYHGYVLLPCGWDDTGTLAKYVLEGETLENYETDCKKQNDEYLGKE